MKFLINEPLNIIDKMAIHEYNHLIHRFFVDHSVWFGHGVIDVQKCVMYGNDGEKFMWMLNELCNIHVEVIQPEYCGDHIDYIITNKKE